MVILSPGPSAAKAFPPACAAALPQESNRPLAIPSSRSGLGSALHRGAGMSFASFARSGDRRPPADNASPFFLATPPRRPAGGAAKYDSADRADTVPSCEPGPDAGHFRRYLHATAASRSDQPLHAPEPGTPSTTS